MNNFEFLNPELENLEDKEFPRKKQEESLVEYEKRIVQEIHQVADLMLAELGILPEEVEWPRIDIFGDQSFYLPSTNVLTFKSNHHRINTYGEELAHWIHHQLSHTTKQEYENIYEFVGRLGEYLVRELAKNTDLEHLLEQPNREKIKSGIIKPEEIKAIENALDGLEKDIHTYIEDKSKIEPVLINVRQATENAFEKIKTLTKEKELDEEPSDPEIKTKAQEFLVKERSERERKIELKENVEQIESPEINQAILNLLDTITELSHAVDKESLIWSINLKKATNRYLSLFMNILSDITTLTNTTDTSKPYTNEIINEIHKNFNRMTRVCDRLDFYISGNPMESDINFRLKTTTLLSHIAHMEGYVAAEFYVQNNPDWRKHLPDIIRQPYETLCQHVNTDEVNLWLKESGNADLYPYINKINELLNQCTPKDDSLHPWEKTKIAIKSFWQKVAYVQKNK